MVSNSNLINLIKKLFHRYERFIKYCLIGFSGVSIDFLIFFALNHYLGIFYQFANIISYSSGTINNFFLNAFWNFKKKDTLLKSFMMFYGVGLFGLCLSSIMLYIFIELMDLMPIIAKGITIFIITLVQFSLNSIFTFGERKKDEI